MFKRIWFYLNGERGNVSGCLLQYNDLQFPIKWGYLYLRAFNILQSIAQAHNLWEKDAFSF